MNTTTKTIESGKKWLRSLTFAFLALGAVAVTGCKDDDDDDTPTGPTGTTIELTGDITTNAFLTANNKYTNKI